ncbi:hypothetical protein G9A89_019509 [Geosiphon pyriformis]|nr:hypothetical protein G9A89_019509 [Geosiphon pyriformis]
MNYKIVSSSPFKALKVFKLYFVSSLSYAKTSVSPVLSEFPLLVAYASSVTVDNSLVFFWLTFLKSDLAKLFVLVEFIVKPVGFMVKIFEQFVNSNLVSSSMLENKVNELIVYLGIFNKSVGKLEREVITLKTECDIENVDLFSNFGALVGVSDEVFEFESLEIRSCPIKTAKWLVELVPNSFTLFDIIQKMSILDKFSCKLAV